MGSYYREAFGRGQAFVFVTVLLAGAMMSPIGAARRVARPVGSPTSSNPTMKKIAPKTPTGRQPTRWHQDHAKIRRHLLHRRPGMVTRVRDAAWRC